MQIRESEKRWDREQGLREWEERHEYVDIVNKATTVTCYGIWWSVKTRELN